MNVQVVCSNCGHRSRMIKVGYDYSRPATEIIKAGWASYGSAFYCKKCAESWEKRNGKDRPLWGNDNTEKQIYLMMIDDLMNENEYLKTGERSL